MIYVADCEGDGLTPTKFHCLSFQGVGEKGVDTVTTHEEMKVFLLQDDLTLIMHNGMRWDLPQLSRVLKINPNINIIDTLAISWYMSPNRQLHGLEGYGEDYGIPKPKIDDWHNLPLEEYVRRCEEDVKINMQLWKDQRRYLARLYEVHEDEVINLPIIKYLMFKMRTAALQEKSRWKIDQELCVSTLEELGLAKEEKVLGLAKAMPKVTKYKEKTMPAKPFKKDGSLSAHGHTWFDLLQEHNLPSDYTGGVKVVSSIEEPNPNSPEQVKDWLFGLGWKPATYKYVREDDGTERKIPQVRKDDGGQKVLCPSVLLLAEKEPAIELLDGLTVITHRMSILDGFLKNVDEGGCVAAEIQGLTNTLRFKHKTVVNLPGVDKAYGKQVRGALIAREGYELLGSDMNSLESMTKRHYMWDYDPDYVTEMSVPGFDEHLDLAKFAGVVSAEDVELYTQYKEAKDLSDNLAAVVREVAGVRKFYKPANYSAIYGIGKDKLARELGVPVFKAAALLDAYWKRNWSIKKLSEDQKVKTIRGQMWLFNPVSKFWYSLRFQKDIFSTLNQGTGVFAFDTWVAFILSKRPQITASFHDEVVLEVKKGYRQEATKLLMWAIEQTNKKLKLNVQLGVSADFGHTYADIH